MAMEWWGTATRSQCAGRAGAAACRLPQVRSRACDAVGMLPSYFSLVRATAGRAMPCLQSQLQAPPLAQRVPRCPTWYLCPILHSCSRSVGHCGIPFRHWSVWWRERLPGIPLFERAAPKVGLAQRRRQLVPQWCCQPQLVPAQTPGKRWWRQGHGFAGVQAARCCDRCLRRCTAVLYACVAECKLSSSACMAHACHAFTLQVGFASRTEAGLAGQVVWADLTGKCTIGHVPACLLPRSNIHCRLTQCAPPAVCVQAR